MPDPTPQPAADGLQFDRAEVAPALKCSACPTEINETYYKLAGKVICLDCHEKAAAPADEDDDATAAPDASKPKPASTPSATPAKPAPAPIPRMNPVLAIILQIGIAYAIPILAGFSNIIGLFIIGIGLYQAFKLN